MKIEGYKFPKSSFLSVDKDLSKLADMVIKNKRLQKLLYYSSKDCLKKSDLTDDQVSQLFGNYVKIIPELLIDPDVRTYLVIKFDNFSQSYNPEFRDNIIEFDIISHFDQWQLNDFELRPYRIAGEIDSMLQTEKLSGFGKIDFISANQFILNDEYAGLCLMYSCVHGGEDKVDPLNPQSAQNIIENFNQMYNE